MPDDVDLGALRAQARRIAAEQAVAGPVAGLENAAAAALAGRRGPGMPGSAQRVPGVYAGSAGGFGTGQPLDVAPGGSVLLGFAERAAGDDDRFGGACDDELIGVICALDRAEASACSLKHAAVAELIRRRPAPGCAPGGPAQMPEGRDEFAEQEVAQVLAEGRGVAAMMLDLAQDLEVSLPGTRAAFRAGIVRQSKAQIIALAAGALDPAEARAAEAMVLGRAGRLTPGGLRSAMVRAVMAVAPDKARRRREEAAKDARVERWAEDSGNAALAGRELPPAEVLAADQRITWWARQLRKAGLAGNLDELRARAYLDILLDKDSRPAASAGGAGSGGPGDPGQGGSGPEHPAGPQAPPGTGARPAGFTGRLHLTVPLATLLDLADRPGEIPGLGPVDPWLARDLARAAAQNPKTTWCLTVTDEQGHAIGHGCARPGPGGRATRGHTQHNPRSPDGRDPPAPPDPAGPPAGTSPDGPGFAVTSSGQDGPPGGYGSYRLRTGIAGQPDLLIALDPIATDTCDHRFEAAGHDPGVKLRHLAEIRHATCTGPTCRRPSSQCDFEHNTPYEAGGRTCLCNGGPKCRHDHRLKQHPGWKAEQLTPGTFRWTTPSGRTYTTEPTRYPI